MNAPVFRQDMRRAIAASGALALIAGFVFALGAWDGFVRAWPVSAWLELAHGPLKPFVVTPELRQSRFDPAGRLLAYMGKTEVDCPKQTARTAVILIAGQSNAANNGAQRHVTRHPDRVFNSAAGRCYVAASPLLGSTGAGGEYWTLMADELVERGAFDVVILAPVAVGGSPVEQWAADGALNRTMVPLVQDVTDRYRITHVLWHQGETDAGLHTDPVLYKDRFLSFVGTLRANGVDAPVFVSQATRCGPKWPDSNPIRMAQHDLVSLQSGLKPGVDTDTLIEAQDRYDDCHFADSGEVKSAAAWVAALTDGAPGP